MLPFRRMALLFVIGALGYAALSYLTFKMPATLADGELCGFVEQDFNAAGQFVHAPVSAWWISFTRLQEFWTAVSVGLSVAFVGFALTVGRRAGGRPAAGAAMGGGVLALALGMMILSFCLQQEKIMFCTAAVVPFVMKKAWLALKASAARISASLITPVGCVRLSRGLLELRSIEMHCCPKASTRALCPLPCLWPGTSKETILFFLYS